MPSANLTKAAYCRRPVPLLPRLSILLLALLGSCAQAAPSDNRLRLHQSGVTQSEVNQPDVNQPDVNQPVKELWLFGGGEKICSSVEPQHCLPAQAKQAAAFFASSGAVSEKTFACTAQSRQLLTELAQWPAEPEQNQQPASAPKRLATILQALPRQPLSERAFHQALAALQLNDDELALLEDACELAPPAGAELKIFWPGTDPTTQQMFRQLVQAGAARSQNPSKKPVLLLITASSYNPYQWVSYYRQLFSAAGAEVRWLPIEAAWSQQLTEQQPKANCAAIEAERLVQSGQLRRAAMYPLEALAQQQACQQPALLTDWVEQADVVFINGGDQSLTLRALTNASGDWTTVAKTLLHRVRQQGVILAGSSAGNAVQAGRLDGKVAMISGGRQQASLQYGALATDINSPGCAITKGCQTSLVGGQLTYRPQGGLQLFSLGVNDTHFYERSREARLLRLVLDSHSGAGFGVDEATVLRARFANEDEAELSVLGHGGVWLLDAGAASGQLPTVQSLQHAATEQQPIQAQNQKQAQPKQPAQSKQPAQPQHQLQANIQQLSVSRIFAGDVLHYQRPANGQGVARIDVLQRSCTPSAVSAAQLDSTAYAPITGQSAAGVWQLDWQLQPPLQGCLRHDGRWQYLQQQLNVQLTLTPANTLTTNTAGFKTSATTSAKTSTSLTGNTP